MPIAYTQGEPSKYDLKEGQVTITNERGEVYLYTKINGQIKKIKFEDREQLQEETDIDLGIIDGGVF